MAGGRPTKYKKEYCQELIEFFSQQPDNELEEVTYYQNGLVKSRKPVVHPLKFPTFQGFAMKIGVDTRTLQRWRDEHEEFCRSYARAQEIQEAILVQETIEGRYNAQFAKFFAVNRLNYHDKVEQETTFNDISFHVEGVPANEADEITG